MTPETSKLVKRFLSVQRKMNKAIDMEYRPIIIKAVQDKDKETLLGLIHEIPSDLSFNMWIYQALAEIKKQDKTL